MLVFESPHQYLFLGYFQPAYIPPPQATVPSQQQPTNPPAEYISVYPNPHMQIVYQSQPAPAASANPMVYPGQAPVIYASTQTPIYQQQSAPYPPQQITPQMGAQTMTPYPQVSYYLVKISCNSYTVCSLGKDPTEIKEN